MCFSKFFALFRKAKPQPQEEPKRVRTRIVGQYNPKCDYVRVDNVTVATGVSTKTVHDYMAANGIVACRLDGKRGQYITKQAAMQLHNDLAKNQ